MSSAEVVVTGAAALGAHGCGTESLLAALRAGRSLASPWEPDGRAFPVPRTRAAATCPALDLTPWLDPGASRRMSRLSQWAVAAGRMALQDAGLEGAAEDLAVCLGSAFGPSDFVNQLLFQVLRESPRAASPFLFTDCVANAPAGQLAIAVGARGANHTLSQREAGPVMALVQGFLELRSGRAAAVLVGSADEVEDLQVAVLDRMRALAPDGVARPFDRDRRGVLCGEGAGFLVLETGAAARARGARVLARVLMTGRAFDPTATPTSWGVGGVALGSALRRGLDRAGVGPGSIDFVVSGASGARAGDRLEAEVLRTVFAGRVPPVLVPKAVVGEYGAGGVPVSGLLALAGGGFAVPEGFRREDPALGLRPGDRVPEPAPDRPLRALWTALGSGGAACWAVVEAAG